MPFPTGPAIVGLEAVVLPAAAVWLDTFGDLADCEIAAPTCRYGEALYAPVFIVGATDLKVGVDIDDWIGGGETAAVYVPGRLLPYRIELHLVSLVLAPGALDALSDSELVDALTCRVDGVREAVLLALAARR